MLYDGAIRFATLSEKCIQDNDMAGKGKYIGKVIAILSEFSNTLDFKVGGELADNLDALYTYMIRRLGEANVNNDIQPIKQVRGMLTELRATWQQAIEINNGAISVDEAVANQLNAIGATI